MTVSGHKNISSIQSYAKTSDSKKREMCDTLADAMQPKKSRSDPQVNNTKDESKELDLNNLSFRQLLELTLEEEKALFDEIMSGEIKEGKSSGTLQVQQPQNKVALPSVQSVVPKMMFNNSNVTINFNIQK